jgi:hypothetical protein
MHEKELSCHPQVWEREDFMGTEFQICNFNFFVKGQYHEESVCGGALQKLERYMLEIFNMCYW